MRHSPLGRLLAVTALSCSVLGASATNLGGRGLDDLLDSGLYTIISAPAATATPDLDAIRASVVAGNFSRRLPPAARASCPVSCSSAGVNSSAWFNYHSVNRLDKCNNTLLLDFALANDLDNPSTHINIAACTADLDVSTSTSAANTTTCQGPAVDTTQTSGTLELATSGSSSSEQVAGVIAALDQLQAYATLSGPSCDPIIKYAYTGDVAVGMFVGSALASQGVIASVLEQLKDQIQTDGSIAETLLVQQCEGVAARYGLGIYIDASADLSSVQSGMQSWTNASCIALDTATSWQNITYSVPSASATSNSTTTISNSTTALRTRYQHLRPRDDTCSTVQVVSGDSCGTLATECGITAAEFTEYNPSSTLCSSLTPGQYVCCSSGDLPDLAPSAYSNGTCYTYLVQSGDSCSNLAAAYDITTDEIEEWNADTWGWYGCADLLAGYTICLSDGDPPFPAPVANAVCGPQVPGTATPPEGTDFSTMNQCPLNACCDIWGQCGTDIDFCTISNSSTGAPGTAAPGSNGCISNCGITIIVSAPPDDPYTIGYFEAYDVERPCLSMSVLDVDTTVYTHIHFAFATLNADFSLNITSNLADQLVGLENMENVKKIISIGGWDFSTDPSTYSIFRDAVSSDSNRETLALNVVDFLKEYGFDGVDWDWEYPDEPDIPGIPAGTEDDAIGYFLLLDELRAWLGSDYTISFTAPASYWYLQTYYLEAMAAVTDYIVLMTYDLHGQWDYGNDYADSGCPAGNCLRSHVNLTETLTSLAMVTKALVPSNQVVVGVSSYGRSFEMTTAGCYGNMCTYTGPDSGALPGICTETAGYISDYEIGLIVSENPSAETYWDSNSFSNIVVYNETQWVAFMNDSNKEYRKTLYTDLTFLGTADWAVDLQSLDGDGETNDNGTYQCMTEYPNQAIVEYATAATVDGTVVCTGASTTVQAGKSIIAQIAADVTVPVGTLTGDALYTSISSALAAGCSVPTQGATITECGDIPAITGIVWAEEIKEGDPDLGDYYYVPTDAEAGISGKIEMEVVVMNVWDQDVLDALIGTVAATIKGLSENSSNSVLVYEPSTSDTYTDQGPSFEMTTVAGVVLAMYTEQTADTNGALQMQDFEVKLSLETGDGGEYECGIGALVMDSIGLIGVVPGFEWIDTFTAYQAVAAGGVSLACLVQENISPDSAEDQGGGGDDGGDGGDGGDSTTTATNTLTLAPNPNFPCTSTLANSAIVEYATSTVSAGTTLCTGSASTIAAGKAMTVQIANDQSVALGTLTGAALYTSVSSALAAGCTVSKEGVTVTACGDIPEITGITYYETEKNSSGDYNIVYGGLADTPQGGTDGKIEMDIVLMRVWEQDVLEALIQAVAGTLQGLSVNASNNIPVWPCSNCDLTEGATYTNYTTVSGVILAVYTEQTLETDGSVQTQDLQVQFKLDADSGEFDCSAGAFVFDALAIIAAIPGFEWLVPIAATGAAAMSLSCVLSDEMEVE
ncbi:hypothetical protein BX600DRAFT_407914 [Xylariales sp. PMI_506]|nr:hypothetical protein BX600DRAFT_407914 [Xylariales sp. PMI_506]